MLVACTRDPGDEQTPTLLREALARVDDWPAVAEAASRHKMERILFRRVADFCPEAVPADVHEAWRVRSVRIARRSLIMQSELLKLLAALDAAAVPAVAFKGPVFSQQLYGVATLRHFSDLDLLVPHAHVAAARVCLLGAGFVDAVELGEVAHGTLQAGMQEIVLMHAHTRIPVEIHWREGPRFAAESLSADMLVERSVPLELLGRQIAALAPADVALVIAVHAATHDWQRLEDVAAMAAALTRLTPAEAAGLGERAGALRCRRRLHLGVLLAASIADCDVPAPLAAAALADRTAVDLAARAGGRLLRATAERRPPRAGTPAEAARREIRQARALDSPVLTLSYLWRRLFTPGIHEWSRDEQPKSGPLAAASTFVRRQRRLWER